MFEKSSSCTYSNSSLPEIVPYFITYWQELANWVDSSCQSRRRGMHGCSWAILEHALRLLQSSLRIQWRTSSGLTQRITSYSSNCTSEGYCQSSCKWKSWHIQFPLHSSSRGSEASHSILALDWVELIFYQLDEPTQVNNAGLTWGETRSLWKKVMLEVGTTVVEWVSGKGDFVSRYYESAASDKEMLSFSWDSI